MSAASASIRLSTSQRDTTSTGATWIKRNRSHLPYQPHPITPTRFFELENSSAHGLRADRASPAALSFRNFLRLTLRGRRRRLLEGVSVSIVCWMILQLPLCALSALAAKTKSLRSEERRVGKECR